MTQAQTAATALGDALTKATEARRQRELDRLRHALPADDRRMQQRLTRPILPRNDPREVVRQLADVIGGADARRAAP